MRNQLFFALLIILASFGISGCGSGSSENYLDMAFDDDNVVSSTSIGESGWSSLAAGEASRAAERFYEALASSPGDPLVSASLYEGLGWAHRDISGIVSAIPYFEKACAWTRGAKIGLAYGYVSRAESGDMDRAIKQFELAGVLDSDYRFVPDRDGTTRDVDVHAMVAMALFLRNNPGDQEKSRSQVIRVKQLLQEDYSKAADDLVKALEAMGLNAS